MDSKLTVKIEIYDAWSNPWKEDHYENINILIINNSNVNVILDIIKIVIINDSKEILLNKAVLGITNNTIGSKKSILLLDNKYVYSLLKFKGYLFTDFCLVVTYNENGISKSIPINITNELF